jgi:predicted phage-related endonuclease
MTKAATIDLEERRSYIGASEVAAALGLSPWNDPIGLAMDKWGEREPKEASFRMRLGLLVEPIIGTLYREETGRKLIAGGSRTRRMKKHPWIGAHPDFYVLDGARLNKGLVQAKLSDEFGDGVPLHYRLQGIAELAVTGAPWIDFAVLEGRSFRVFRVEPDPGEIEDLVADLDDYWHGYIVPKILPPPSSESGGALHERYPRAKLDVGKLANDAQVEKLAEIARLKAEQKLLKEAEDKLANEIKLAIGDAKWIEGGGYRATWSRWESDKVAWEEVATAYRAIIDEVRVAEESELSAGGKTFLPDLPDLRTIESIYTRKEPGNRLTVSTPKEKA